MEQRRIEQKIKEVSILEDILCDKCGKSVKKGNDEHPVFEGTTLTASFGYGSNKDGLIECFDICDACYDDFTSTFIYKPTEKPGNWPL